MIGPHIDKNGRLSLDEFASDHQNIMEVIDYQFFDGKKEIDFDKYCLYMVLFGLFEINEIRIKKVFNNYCKMRRPESNGKIKISDFFDQKNNSLTMEQFEEILEHMSNSLSFDFNPGEINYEQFKEFVGAILTFTLMDRNNDRFISNKEVKFFVKFMGNCNTENEVKAFFEAHDLDDDGNVSVYEFLLTKYVPMYHM